MSISSKIRDQIISTFRAELAEHIQTITDGLLLIEQSRPEPLERQNTLESIFRAAHSLKGAARAVGVTAVEQLGHALENVLAGLQKGTLAETPGLFTACYGALDAIQAVEAGYEAGETTPPLQTLQAIANLDALRTGASSTPAPMVALSEPLPPVSLPSMPVFEESQPAGVSAVTASMGDDTIRVRIARLDALVAQMSELIVAKIRLEEYLARLREIQNVNTTWQKNWHNVRDSYATLTRRWHKSALRVQSLALYNRDDEKMADWMNDTQDWMREINTTINELVRDYNNDVAHTALVIDALEAEVKQMRMLPLTTITGTFGRMLRDVAHSAGKEIVFELVGGDVEMDKHVLEKIKDPLIHLLRNAVDHGIEPPAVREALGKPRAGQVTLAAEQLGKDVVLSISDDGRGLDLDAVRRTVARYARVNVSNLDENSLVAWIFNAGISTSQIVTDLSGRGVGLDVVRRNVDSLQGRIEVDWKAGEGTTFTMILPMALTSSRVLLIQTASQPFAIPVSVVQRLVTITPRDISFAGGQNTVTFDGRPLPLYYLCDVLRLPRQKKVLVETDPLQVMVINAADRLLAFIVDGLLGEQEIVIKGLGHPLVRVGGIAGATVTGSGQVLLVLNAADLVKLAVGQQSGALVSEVLPLEVVPAQKKPKHILVVDDSITTRTLERNILEARGFQVDLAINGQEALNFILTRGAPDLVITDVSMPKMTGFELASRIKGDARTADLPVILVTSLDTPEDKARGVESGADAYIVKGRFDQANLLETIQQLIG